MYDIKYMNEFFESDLILVLFVAWFIKLIFYILK